MLVKFCSKFISIVLSSENNSCNSSRGLRRGVESLMKPIRHCYRKAMRRYTFSSVYLVCKSREFKWLFAVVLEDVYQQVNNLHPQHVLTCAAASLNSHHSLLRVKNNSISKIKLNHLTLSNRFNKSIQ